MHPRIQEILASLEASDAELQQAVAEIPAGVRSRRPSTDRWSAAEVIDHLALVEQSVARLIRQRAAEAQVGPDRDEAPVAPTFDSARVRDRRQPRVAREAIQPRTGIDETSAWTDLESAKQALRDTLLTVDGLSLCDVSAPHPAFGPLNLYQWFLFVAAHKARHTDQIREIGASLSSSLIDS